MEYSLQQQAAGSAQQANQSAKASSVSVEQFNESELLAKLRAGDAESFEYLVRHYGGYLMTITRRYLKSEADVQDSVQDTFLQVLRSVGQFEGRSTLKSWLHRIAVNAALMKIRASGRRPEDLIDDISTLFNAKGKRIEAEAEIGDSTEIQAIDQETRRQVRQQIAQLPELPRNLLLLRDIEGYSTEETAALLEMSVPAVKTGLHRARRSLKKAMEM